MSAASELKNITENAQAKERRKLEQEQDERARAKSKQITDWFITFKQKHWLAQAREEANKGGTSIGVDIPSSIYCLLSYPIIDPTGKEIVAFIESEGFKWHVWKSEESDMGPTFHVLEISWK